MRLNLKDMRTIITGLKSLETAIVGGGDVGGMLSGLDGELINVPSFLRNGDGNLIDTEERETTGDDRVDYIRNLRREFEKVYESIDSGVGFNVSFDSEGYVSTLSQ